MENYGTVATTKIESTRQKERLGLCCAKKVSQKRKSAVKNKMTDENVGGKAIRCYCLAGLELKREDKMGGLGIKCRFRFSKALIAAGDIG